MDTTHPQISQTTGLWLPTRALWRREMVRFFRQKNRVIGALATPLVFWLMLGTGLNNSFVTQVGQENPQGYLSYFYPGTIILMVLFTAIFSTISVIEDRNEGFLQGVLVSPIPRLAIVLGKVLGGASIATIQGCVMICLWPFIGDMLSFTQIIMSIIALFIVGIGLTSLGLCIAWKMDTTAGYHAIMNLFLMPMWFLSGAVFSLDNAPTFMQYVMYANPLTYGQITFANAISGSAANITQTVSPNLALIILTAFTGLLLLLAVKIVAKPSPQGV